MEKIRGKTLEEWKERSRDDGISISAAKYIFILEELLERSESEVEDLQCMHPKCACDGMCEIH
tara:strand:+ start:11919 stop:12107 length:189 start_codon:yes stop_codon:yes gene_type:complete